MIHRGNEWIGHPRLLWPGMRFVSPRVLLNSFQEDVEHLDSRNKDGYAIGEAIYPDWGLKINWRLRVFWNTGVSRLKVRLSYPKK